MIRINLYLFWIEEKEKGEKKKKKQVTNGIALKSILESLDFARGDLSEVHDQGGIYLFLHGI